MILGMSNLSLEKKSQILACLTDGMSIRATVRVTGAAKNTVRDLIREVGPACEEFQRHWFRDLTCADIQCDEIWAFVGCKQKNMTDERRGGDWGNVWTFTAFCRTCKLLPVWRVGGRDLETTKGFMLDLASRMATKFQLSTDAFETYISGVVAAFTKADIDYAMIDKNYASSSGSRTADARYSPGRLVSVKKRVVIGEPDDAKICTSHVERSNLNIRMMNRRFTRLTNAFSRRVEMHRYSIALTFFAYNFIRKHSSLGGKTPAMAAGIAAHPFTVRDMLFASDQQSAAA